MTINQQLLADRQKQIDFHLRNPSSLVTLATVCQVDLGELHGSYRPHLYFLCPPSPTAWVCISTFTVSRGNPVKIPEAPGGLVLTLPGVKHGYKPFLNMTLFIVKKTRLPRYF